MRRLRRGMGIGAAVTLLLLRAPVEGASAAPKGPSSGQQGGQGDERQAEAAQQRPRKKPAEPKGNPASPAAMRAGRLSCGDVITKSTTLVADIGPCAGDGIIIGADNIRLNLNGHTISGTPGVGNGNAAGIRLPFRTGITITGHPGNSGKTGTVTGFDGGVFVNGGSGNTVENLVVIDNIGPPADQEPTLADGIVFFHSAKNRIMNNTVIHNGAYDGIGVLGVNSNDNLIQGNTVERTPATQTDFVADGTGTGILINNFLDEDGIAVRRGQPIRNNNLLNNIVRRNDNSGISAIANTDSRIVGNIVEDNGQKGERSVPGRFGGFISIAVASPSNGIGLTAGPIAPAATRVLIEGNTVTGNTGNGIFIGTEDNRVTGNRVVGNGGSGAGINRFDLRELPARHRSSEAPCAHNVYRDNSFDTAFPDCIYEQQGLTPPPPPSPPGDGDGGELELEL
ncbi:MAG: right-handed parallel beta-helix repeat-containing protein [Chloroflexota bacterium]|nr:right-handed parallel beta-helix repeat-containing protein [Chloroflexota bacterium]